MTDHPSLEHAIAKHLNGDLEFAAQSYQLILEQDPIHPTALHYFGIYLYQSGRHGEAIETLQLASALDPDNSEWLNNLGNVYFSLSHYDMAEAAYADAARMAERDHLIWTNLGAAQMQLEQLENAKTSFLRALELSPEYAPAMQHLGSIFENAGDKMTASHYQCRAYVLPPLEGKSREMLGISFYFLGRLDEAAQVYRDWLREEPSNPVAEHMLAACSQEDVPARASDNYVERHFDKYAETFERNLVDSLKYQGPAMIQEGLRHIGDPRQQFTVLDIGCGTGMCAPVLTPYCDWLVGVDLSAKMLEKAQDSGSYDLLVKGEIGSYLDTTPSLSDLIVAADTMIYFGDLVPILGSVFRALSEEGYFVFTVEVLDPSLAGTLGYRLHASGRYRHATNYVIRRLNQANMELIHHSFHTLRLEIGAEIEGAVFVAKKRQ